MKHPAILSGLLATNLALAMVLGPTQVQAGEGSGECRSCYNGVLGGDIQHDDNQYSFAFPGALDPAGPADINFTHPTAGGSCFEWQEPGHEHSCCLPD
jgi:hypothetical protein